MKILMGLCAAYSTPKAISLRAEIILASVKNFKSSIMESLKLTRKTVNKWINRWLHFTSKFFEITEEYRMKNMILECLRDAYRSGRPSTYSSEEITTVIHLACTTPESINVPLSHWSSRSLAKYLKDHQIIKKISHERVAFFLKKCQLQPHRSRYWLNSRTRNSKDYEERIKEICILYRGAIEMHKKGVHVVSIDEKSGIQAIERAEPNLPMRQRSPEKIEHEYTRYGTQCLIANLEVGTGKIIAPMVSETRKNNDFLCNIKNLVALDPSAEWVFILDQLNTHKSEELVKFIVQEINFEGDLGKAGYHGSGILKSMNSRMEFLERKTHRIRFQFTPKHCSWMNQIEIWFSGFSKRYVKRANNSSLDKLREGILHYIEYFNCNYAKPFNWTYKGKVLQA